MNLESRHRRLPIKTAAIVLGASLFMSGAVKAAPGDALGPAFTVNTTVNSSQGIPAVAFQSDGSHIVVWQGSSTTQSAYFGIVGQRFAADGTRLGGEFAISQNEGGGSDSFAAVAVNDAGEFIVTWTHTPSGVGIRTVRARRFNANAVALGPQFQVRSQIDGAGREPDVGIDGSGRAVLVLRDDIDGRPLLRRLDASGTPLAPEESLARPGQFLVGSPRVAVAADGRFVVATTYSIVQQNEEDEGKTEIRVQRYDAQGLKVGGAIKADNLGGAFSRTQDVAIDAQGDFAVIWQSVNDIVIDNGGINARFYRADGTALGSQFVVATPGSETSRWSLGIAMDADGDAVVSWQTGVPDNSPSKGDVFARRIDFAGQLQGDSFQVNEDIAQENTRPAIGVAANGDFTVVWESTSVPGDPGLGIRARRYEGPGLGFDYGDAPDPGYPTLSRNDGARHALSLDGPHLGHRVDRDVDGRPSVDARGDDTSGGTDDEDGVSFGALEPRQMASLSLTASAGSRGMADAWIDFNRDGDWNDSGERILDHVFVSGGDNVLQFPVPRNARGGITFARVRLSSSGVDAPTGAAPDGEVEDLQLRITGTEVLPSVNFSQIQSVREEGKAAKLSVTLDATSNVTVTVPLIYSGTAVRGTDYLNAPDTLTFQPGQKTVKLNLKTVNDGLLEAAETVRIELGEPVNGQRGAASSHLLTIEDRN